MSMIEVDPELFVTCRLCLKEKGHYQIVPKVQMQIKYCFEINVEPFDGLPQLICKECESTLRQYAGIKQMYQEKQSNFIEKLKNNANNQVAIEHTTSPDTNEDSPIQQQQDTVSSTQHIDTVNKNIEPEKKEKVKRESLSINFSKKVPPTEDETLNSKTENLSSNKEDKSQIKTTNSVSTKKRTSWAGDYNRTFACRICSITYKNKKDIMSHITKKHERLLKRYSNVLNSHCYVPINKMNRTPNKTGRLKYVVFNENKIIRTQNALYYVLYSVKGKRERSPSPSSEEDVTRSQSKYKRQRFISDDSYNTATTEPIEENITTIDIEKQNEKSDENDQNDKNDGEEQIPEENIDCININDDNKTSNQSNEETTSTNLKPVTKPSPRNKMTFTDILTACQKKYLNRYDTSKNASKLQENMESYLQHKFLSVGTKIVHKALNSTGLLRYLEHKSLDINWLPSKNSNTIIKTKLKDANPSSVNLDNLALKNITHYFKGHPTRDFVDIFENVSSEKQSLTIPEKGETSSSSSAVGVVSDNDIEKPIKTIVNPILNNLLTKTKETENEGEAVLILRSPPESDKQNCTKILNASPVANPKQLPNKKTNTSMPTETLPGIDDIAFHSNNDESIMPVITSTVSLANSDAKNNTEVNTPSMQVNTQDSSTETNFPRIKVKPVSELMPVKSVLNQNPPAPRTTWTATNLVPIAPNTSMVYVTHVPQYNTVEPSRVLSYPQRFSSANSKRTDISESNGSPRKDVPIRPVTQECVKMHTVELPNTKTKSPFTYFQRLLQFHNIVLMDSTAVVPNIMKCIIKFTLGFQQENNVPVSLSLTLFSDGSVFCIKVTDMTLKEIDISKLSANWQWEILKVFKGDIVSKLQTNALKHGLDMNCKVNYFVSLLKSIVFTK